MFETGDLIVSSSGSLWYFIFFPRLLWASRSLADLFSLSNLIWREWDNVSASPLARHFDVTSRHRVCRSNFQLQSLSLWSIQQRKKEFTFRDNKKKNDRTPKRDDYLIAQLCYSWSASRCVIKRQKLKKCIYFYIAGGILSPLAQALEPQKKK